MEKIAKALQSDDLSHYERPCDSDTVRALGLTAIHRSLGVLILEAREACAGESWHDAARIRDLTAAVANVARRQADRDKLKVDTLGVARQLVRELVMDLCPRCHGRGFLPTSYGPDVPDGRGVDCPTCLGSGKARRKPQERARAAGMGEYGRELGRFYDALERRLIDAELGALDHYKWRSRTP